MIGQAIAHYKVTAKLGAGGMGEVYRARDEKLERDVALKVLPAGSFSEPTAHSRLLREARSAAALNHPHICTIYEVGESGGTTYIAMELVEGQPLSKRLEAGALPAAQVVRYGSQIADALSHAHERQVVHRDLKSANVMITPEGRVKVLDFGLAKRLSEDHMNEVTRSQESLTTPGTIVGTLAYMAPEQLRGEPADARSDIWALGVVQFEMAAGARPFQGHTGLALSSAVLNQSPVPLPKKVPVALRAVIERCLEKDPSRRYQRAGEVRAALEAIHAGTTTPWAAWRYGFARRRLRAYVTAGAFVLAAAAASMMWLSDSKPTARSEWVQLTNFPDSVTQPALSPDGRMLAFIRGPGSFTTSGQIYVKMLPDGEPKPLTRDNLMKMGPVFSPDGSRIAYTTLDAQNNWDTWVVPVLGGEPRPWLPNASGLAWIDKQRVVFSEIIDKLQGNHMKLVVAEESRADSRDLYVPMPSGAMAHRSFASPDGKWVLTSEMSDRGVWLPCRLVPSDASSSGRPVGPPGAPCWFAAWSPDRKWMYLCSRAGGGFHIWRQRFRESGTLPEPEQITSGPTEEEGIALLPDGGSIITSVGLMQSSVWVRDPKGERQVSLEGYAYLPKFTPDGKRLLYAVQKSGSAGQGQRELWVANMDSGRSEPLLPGFLLSEAPLGGGYDISSDGRRLVIDALDREGRSRLWLAPLDRRSPPRQIPHAEGDGPLFGAGGEIFFRGREGAYGFAYRVREDGTGLQKAIEYPVIETKAVSPDGKWLVVYARPHREATGATLAFPMGGGPPVRLYGPGLDLQWSRDARLLFLSVQKGFYSGRAGNTYVLSLPPGRMLPEICAGGFGSEAEIASLPGVRVINSPDVAPSPRPEVYALSRETVQRNLYRIPVP